MEVPRRDGSEAQAIALAEALRAGADIAGLGIVMVTLDGDSPEFLYTNAWAARAFGLSVAEQSPFEATCLEGTGLLAQLQKLSPKDASDASPRRFESTLRSKDDGIIPVEVAVQFTQCLARPVAVCYFTDLRERAATIAALADSEARFRSLVDGAPDGIAIIIAGRIAFVNPAATRLLGATHAEEIVGQSLLDLLEPEDAERAEQRIQQILRTQRQLGEPAEYKSRRVDGQVIHVEISSIPIEWKGQNAVLGFARDVTERKAMHSRLLHKDRLATVGALSAGLAHEVNNPLSYVLLNLQYIERELARRLGPRADWQTLSERLQDAVHGAERVAAIVRDLKTFSRTDTGNFEPVDLARVVESAIRVAQNAVEHNATLRRDIRPVRAVLCSPQRIEQVVLNLLINAAQSIEHGDVARDTIGVRVFEDGEEAVLQVSDTGRGMAEHERRRIFEPFFTTKPAGIGTGLGLSICRNIVEAAGGSISVESEPSRGSTFTVRLPLTEQTASYPPPPTNEIEPTPRATERLLLIEGSAFTPSVRQALQSDYDVVSAVDLREAERLLETGAHFELVVCDAELVGNLEGLVELQNKFEPVRKRLLLVADDAMGAREQQLLADSGITHVPPPLSLDAVRQLLGQRGRPN